MCEIVDVLYNIHMDNHLKSKLIIYSTLFAYYLHNRILTLEYFEYLNYNEIIKSISIFLRLMPRCCQHEQAHSFHLLIQWLIVSVDALPSVGIKWFDYLWQLGMEIVGRRKATTSPSLSLLSWRKKAMRNKCVISVWTLCVHCG